MEAGEDSLSIDLERVPETQEEGFEASYAHTLGESARFPRWGVEGQEGCGDKVHAYKEQPL
jgi:hypothetical protein